MKFGRVFYAKVQGRYFNHLIQSPLTCRFSVTRNSLYSCGPAHFQFYNLTKDVRNDIYRDAYQFSDYKQIVFSAGYLGEPERPIIYQGNIYQAYSYRQGPDWITELDCRDGGNAVDRATINLTKPSPWNFEDAIKSIVGSMLPFNVKLGVIGNFNVPNSRGISFSGNSWDILTQRLMPMQAAEAFIDQEKVFILNQWEYLEIAGSLSEISADTGMIGTPKLQENIVVVKMIFEPRLIVGQLVNLRTEESRMNGPYKVLQIDHQGTISGAVCETLETTVVLYQPDRELIGVAA